MHPLFVRTYISFRLFEICLYRWVARATLTHHYTRTEAEDSELSKEEKRRLQINIVEH